jgi:hypothetical protein
VTKGALRSGSKAAGGKRAPGSSAKPASRKKIHFVDEEEEEELGARVAGDVIQEYEAEEEAEQQQELEQRKPGEGGNGGCWRALVLCPPTQCVYWTLCAALAALRAPLLTLTRPAPAARSKPRARALAFADEEAGPLSAGMGAGLGSQRSRGSGSQRSRGSGGSSRATRSGNSLAAASSDELLLVGQPAGRGRGWAVCPISHLSACLRASAPACCCNLAAS